MVTEIYTVEQKGTELEDLVKDGDNQILREELGLSPISTGEKTGAPFKFRRITDEESKVYKFLFQQEVKLEDYDEFIPNEVLEAIREFKDSCQKEVRGFVVWKEKDHDPDPVLLANIINDKYSWNDSVYIVARWGSALAPFKELKEKALKEWKAKREESLTEIVEQAKIELAKTKKTQTIGELNMPTFYK